MPRTLRTPTLALLHYHTTYQRTAGNIQTVRQIRLIGTKTSIRSCIRIVQIISFKKRLNLVNRKEQQAHRLRAYATK